MSNSIINIENLRKISEILKMNTFDISESEKTFVCTGNIKSFVTSMLAAGFVQEHDDSELKLKTIIGISPVIFGKWKFFDFTKIDNPFVIINQSGGYCYFNQELHRLIFSDSVESNFKTGCENAFAYARFYNFLKLKEFADHHDTAGQEIVLYSSANGIFRIKYSSIPEIPEDIDFSEGVNTFLSKSESSLHQFFKNAFFSFVKGPNYIVSLDEIIHRAEDVSKLATRNFDIVSKQFNFETFRDSLYREKEKYFAGIREVVNKIFSQAAGVPISIGATVFATYKVDGDPMFLVLILVTFLVYVVYYIRIQFYYNKEINELNSDFIRDFEIIKSKSGLNADDITSEKTKILDKISSAKSIIITLICIIIVLGMLAVIYIFYQLFPLKFTLTGLLYLSVFWLA